MPDDDERAPENRVEQIVLVQNRQLKAQPFSPDKGDQLGTGKAWEAWLQGIEREFRFLKITEDQDKVDALVIYGGPTISRLERSLSDPQDPPGPAEPLSAYDKLKKSSMTTSYPKRTSTMRVINLTVSNQTRGRRSQHTRPG